MFDFQFLETQLSDGVIVEDLEVLARLSLLVPALLDLIRSASPHLMETEVVRNALWVVETA